MYLLIVLCWFFVKYLNFVFVIVVVEVVLEEDEKEKNV